MEGEIGNEGWELLAKAVQLRPGFVESIICSHHVLQEAKVKKHYSIISSCVMCKGFGI